jgi:hypothetical protein
MKKTIILFSILTLALIIPVASAQWTVDNPSDWTIHEEWTIDGYTTQSPAPTSPPSATNETGGGGGGGGGGSSEKFTVNIKIIKDSEPLPSVLVKLSSTKMPDQYENTNINGIATFKLKSGIYDVQVFTDNTLAENLFKGTITVSRAETFTVNLDTQTITPDATPTPSPFEITADFPMIILIIFIGSGTAILLLMITKKRR